MASGVQHAGMLGSLLHALPPVGLCCRGLYIMALPGCRAFDCVARKPGDGQPTKDFEALLTAMPKNCDYSINSQYP